MHSFSTNGARIGLAPRPFLMDDAAQQELDTVDMKRRLPKSYTDELISIASKHGAIPALVHLCMTQRGLSAATEISRTLCVTTAAVMEAMSVLANRDEQASESSSVASNSSASSSSASPQVLDSGVDFDVDPELDLFGDPTKKEEKRVARAKLHGDIRQFIQQTYRDRTGLPCPWDGRTAIRMDRWLLGHAWDLETIKICVLNRFDSDSEVPSQEPAVWIPKLDKFADGPLNEYGKLKGRGSGNQTASNRKALVGGLGLVRSSGADPGRNGRDVPGQADRTDRDVVEGQSRIVPYRRD